MDSAVKRFLLNTGDLIMKHELELILKTINKYNMIKQNDSVVVGVSGGADSVFLLYILNALNNISLNLKLTAVHINHCLREKESDEDESFVLEFCKSLNIPLFVFRVNVNEEAKKQGVSVEVAARNIRYNCFENVFNEIDANKIAVAHNLNDNAETLLLMLFRGTGIKGLCGIPPVRGKIIRPLIEIEREQIEKYLLENNICYRIDSTNSKNIYTRNKIRNNILPYLKNEINPQIYTTLTKTALILSEENEYIEQVAQQAFENCLEYLNENEIALSISKLLPYHISMKRRIIRLGILQLSNTLTDISAFHIDMVVELLTKGTGKSSNLNKQLIAKTKYNYLLIQKNTLNTSNNSFCFDIILDKEIFIKELNLHLLATFKKNYNNLYTKAFCYDKIQGSIKIRSRQDGDKIYIKKINGHKKIKDYLCERKILREKRNLIPLLADGKNIMWILDDKNITNDKYAVNFNCESEKILYVSVWFDLI